MQKETTIRFENKKDFLDYFVRDLRFNNIQLSDSEANVFAAILYFINSRNCFVDNEDRRKYIAKTYKMTPLTISRAFKKLVLQEIIFPLEVENFSQKEFDYYQLQKGVKKAYRINSDIIGKGSFNELRKVEQTSKFYFDEKRGFVDEKHSKFYYGP